MRTDAATSRRFGLILGPALLGIGALLWWRTHHPLAIASGVVGAVLLVFGIVAPRLLGPVERAWMALGHLMGRITTPLLFSVLWWAVFVPIGICRRTLTRSPLARRADASTYWVRRPPVTPELTRAAMERQF